MQHFPAAQEIHSYVVVVAVWCGNFLIVIPLQVIQLCSVLDCGNMYIIAIYCKDTYLVVVVVVVVRCVYFPIVIATILGRAE